MQPLFSHRWVHKALLDLVCLSLPLELHPLETDQHSHLVRRCLVKTVAFKVEVFLDLVLVYLLLEVQEAAFSDLVLVLPQLLVVKEAECLDRVLEHPQLRVVVYLAELLLLAQLSRSCSNHKRLSSRNLRTKAQAMDSSIVELDINSSTVTLTHKISLYKYFQK